MRATLKLLPNTEFVFARYTGAVIVDFEHQVTTVDDGDYLDRAAAVPSRVVQEVGQCLLNAGFIEKGCGRAVGRHAHPRRIYRSCIDRTPGELLNRNGLDIEVHLRICI